MQTVFDKIDRIASYPLLNRPFGLFRPVYYSNKKEVNGLEASA
ncbi:hypothetical protein ACFP3I_22470 [Chryseobacterium arachidis]